MITADDIHWTLEPLPRPEDDHPLKLDWMTPAELLSYCYGQQDDLRSVRGVLHSTVQAVHDLTVERDVLRQRQHQLHDELRTLRAQRPTL